MDRGFYITDYELEHAEIFGGGFEPGRIIGECACCGRDVESGEGFDCGNGEILCSERCGQLMQLFELGGVRRRRLKRQEGRGRSLYGKTGKKGA